MPICFASSAPSASSHSSYTVRKPSSSTWISRSRSVVTGISLPFCVDAGVEWCGWSGAGGGRCAARGRSGVLRRYLPLHRHVRGDRQVAAAEQDVPVHPAERELAQVVQPALLEQRHRTDDSERALAGERLRLVVEVDQHALAAARLDEAAVSYTH